MAAIAMFFITIYATDICERCQLCRQVHKSSTAIPKVFHGNK